MSTKKAPISQQFYLALFKFLITVKHSMLTFGSEFGLSALQSITLLLLDETKPQPMKNFCVLFHCDASNVTGIVDGLERKGLVSRQNDLSDRRVKVVQLEPAGKRVQEEIIEQMNLSKGFLFDPLSETETEQFIQIVEKFAAAVVPAELNS
jgi:DNA-binding MarR family transcriptional regulator